MTLLDYDLFFGFVADATFEDMTKEANPHAVSMFINNSSEEYLQELSHKGKRYIGKFLRKMSIVEDVELIENNIYSIANRIAKNYDFKSNPAVLITTPAQVK